MKVLQVIDKLEVGGAERVAVDLCSLLYENKIAVDFLNLLQPAVLDEELLQKNIIVKYLYRKNKFNPIYLIRLFMLLNNYTIVHVHSRHVLRYVGLTFLVPKFFRKYSIIFHDHYGKIEADKTSSFFLRKCIASCNAYIGVSDSLVAWAMKNGLNKNIYLLENIAREKLGFRNIDTKSKIVVVGNFRKQKNYAFLLAILKNLPETVAIDLYGSLVDQKYYYEIVESAKSLGILNRINIITNEKYIAEIVANYELAIHCAASETGPLVALEYMSKGVPLMMFNTGSVAKVLKENEYDLIMDIFDEMAWSNRIIEVLNAPDQQSYLSQKVRMIYQNFFSEKTYLNKCLKIYQNILSS